MGCKQTPPVVCELSACEAGGSDREDLKKLPPPSPAVCESWMFMKENLDRKKKKKRPFFQKKCLKKSHPCPQYL